MSSAAVLHPSTGQIGTKLLSGVFLSLLITTGLLTAPVNCMCGASVPHGHSLFQLPFHNHASMDHAEAGMSDHPAGHSMHAGVEGEPAAAAVRSKENPILEPGSASYVALSNAMEKQDGWVLQAPPSSSIGQPIAFAQPASIAMPGEESEPLTLPAVRSLEGLETSPETPPPRSAVPV